ncbi:MAG: hypothetical protein ACREE0_15585 [Phenylobacterium sp.]
MDILKEEQLPVIGVERLEIEAVGVDGQHALPSPAHPLVTAHDEVHVARSDLDDQHRTVVGKDASHAAFGVRVVATDRPETFLVKADVGGGGW